MSISGTALGNEPEVTIPTLYEFGTEDGWCGPCENTSIALDKTFSGDSYTGKVQRVLVDIDKPDVTQEASGLTNKNLIDHFNITGIPTIILLNPNGEIFRVVGSQTAEYYSELLETYAKTKE